MKTLKEWKASGKEFADFVKIGDEIDTSVIETLTNSIDSECLGEFKSAFPLAFYKRS